MSVVNEYGSKIRRSLIAVIICRSKTLEQTASEGGT